MKKIVILGAGGFIGGHLVTKLKELGNWVIGVDIKWHEHKISDADEFIISDLTKLENVDLVIDETIDEVYQLGADMGGAEYLFTGDNDADVMSNSVLINLNVCKVCLKKCKKSILFFFCLCLSRT